MIVTSKFANNGIEKQKKTKKYQLVNNSILKGKILLMIKMWKKKTNKSKKRIMILQQWLKTQQDYNKDISIMINKIQKSMLEYELITIQQDRILFPNLNTLLKLSTQMINIIKKFLNNWNPHKTLISQQLINFHKCFIIYREYYNNYYQGQKIRKQIKQRKQYPQFCKTISTLPMDIQSYIIKPVQRPPKYQLLLKQYQKALPPEHEDYQLLKKAIQNYHNVNEQNNQSMDLQLRNQKMIELDQKYGGIINAKRVYLFEEQAKSIDYNVKLYVFNDLIIVARIHNSERLQGYKKIYLNYQSFIECPMDGKYFQNKLFICGIKQNIHLTFLNTAIRNNIYQKIQQIIHLLYNKQINKSTGTKKNKKKMKVMNIQKIEIRNKPVFRISVAGVQRRPNLLNINYQQYYIIKIQAPHPNNIFQLSMVKFDELVAIEEHIRNVNKMLAIPILNDKPQNMSIYDIKKNKTQITQFRCIYIQRFINFILRSEELQQYSQLVAKTLRINQALWKLASYIQPCNCQFCTETRQCTSFQEFQQGKSIIRNSILSEANDQNNYNACQLYPRCSLTSLQASLHCVFNNFMMQEKMLSVQAADLNSLERRLEWLQCKSGRIDYSFLPKSKAQKKIKVVIQLLSLKEDQSVSVQISQKSTVVEVLDEIAEKYKIITLRDFCLVLQYQNTPRILDRDEILWQTLNEIQFQFGQQELEDKLSTQSLINVFNSVKKWSEEMMGGKKSRVYLKKYIFMSREIEMKACESNPERYFLIVWEIFHRFHNQNLVVEYNEIKQICALFYILYYMDRLPYLNQNNFQADKLKNILPKSQHYLLSNQKQVNNFKKQVFFCIKNYLMKIENTLSPLSSKVQIIYQLIVNVVTKTKYWSTLFFNVRCHQRTTLPGAHENVLLGINKKYLIIINNKQLKPLLQIQLQKLSYKISVMSIYIKTQQKQLRFDGQMVFTIKKMIQIYKILDNKFDNEQKKGQKNMR